MQPRVLELIAELAAEHVLVLQVAYIVIANLRSDEGCVCHRWTPLITYADLEGVATTCVKVDATFGATFAEASDTAVANAVTTAIVGSLLCVAYAATKTKAGSLTKE